MNNADQIHKNVQAIMAALPDDFPKPKCVESEESTALVWTWGKYRSVSVNVSDQNHLAYNWLNGTDQGWGWVTFDGMKLPDALAAEIRRNLRLEVGYF